MGIMLLSLVFASPSFIFQKDQPASINIPCFDENNSFCNNSTTCQITIFDPDTEILISYQNMTFNTNYYNYSLNSSQTSELGDYTVNILCEGSRDGFSTFTFRVTPNGEIPSTATAFFYIILLMIIVTGITAGIIGVKRANSIWLRYAYICFVYLLLIAISFIAWKMATDFITSNTFIGGFFHIIFRILMVFLMPFVLLSFIYTLYEMRKIKEIERMIKKGIPYDEAVERSRRK